MSGKAEATARGLALEALDYYILKYLFPLFKTEREV